MCCAKSHSASLPQLATLLYALQSCIPPWDKGLEALEVTGIVGEPTMSALKALCSPNVHNLLHCVIEVIPSTMLSLRKESRALLIVLPLLNCSAFTVFKKQSPCLKTLQACIFQWLFLEIRPLKFHLYVSSISVIQSTYSFLSTQRKSFQPVCYIGATTFMAAPGDLQNTQESVGYNQQGQWIHRATRRGEV